MQLITESSKYPQRKLTFDNIPQAPFPFVGSHMATAFAASVIPITLSVAVVF